MDEHRKWTHQPGDTYHVVSSQYVGNTRLGFHREYVLKAGPFSTRATAWRHGIADLGHDDFNLAIVRSGLLVAMLWDDEVVDDDLDTLADVSNQTHVDWGDHRDGQAVQS